MLTAIEGLSLTMNGFLCRTVRLANEGYDFVDEPESFRQAIVGAGLRADLFTFTQPVSEPDPTHRYYWELDTLAILPIDTYEKWWKQQIKDKTRNMVRKASKKGVVLRNVPLDDELVQGIKKIYDESPVRQGKPFKHYGKDLETLRRAHATYREQSEFVGAFYEDRLIGFIKLVHQNGWSNLMQIISLMSERDKAPTNALIAKAVEICAEKKVPRLQYGIWSRRSIGAFKEHHGFQRYHVPRYYIPMSPIGKAALALGLHRPLIASVPEKWLDQAADLRANWHARMAPSG